MQAYQSAPCPYCGATWNQPGAQACANCNNPLPPPQATYAPPGYAPGAPQGQPASGPGQAPGSPYAAPNYPAQNYPQAPPSYPGYPGQPEQAGPGQPYGVYGPPGYGQTPGYPQPPAGYGQPPGYPGYAPGTYSPTAGTTLRLFGQTFTVPVVLPPAVVQYQQQIAYAIVGILAVFVLLFVITPTLASAQVASAEQSVRAIVPHQARVDAGFASFFAPDPTSTDLNLIKAQGTKQVQSITDALAVVQADESALNGADLRLSILQWVAPPSGGVISNERQRLKTALGGLKQADVALTAGSNQGKVLLPMYDAMIDFTRMYAAINKHDLVAAGAPYPDAQQKLEQAISLDQAPGVPASLAKQLTAFNDLLTNTESLVQAIQNKDAAGIKKYSDAVQAGLKAIAPLADAVPADYRVKTYGPMQKAYDAAIKSVES